ncbi:DNA polymerase IV [Lederbergia wuyishanensis]|uniref:DNA polymerase IV n=1 Tax=Lederbergia wuyishanensis TaxID=1347903 RepID=A0ABU0D159_9BACI|nr:DNA polymerase IV [Lederbergia wuyishanensis]MCJ8006760.1 DNA polymerase IV [Lederbergia wuyishanensis]MDQ0342142.1 DNA polymerase-4 [Lederbergia wuyishanensis]
MKELYPKKGRVILHVDMNSFFASVEMAYDPSLKDKPLAIAGDEEARKGIVVTCSYEARKYGVKTTMPLWEAKKLCPHLIIKRPNFERYRNASMALFEILRRYSELVEPVSIDEGYIDITECYELGSPIEIANDIQQSLLNQLDLPCSIGIAPNKFLAKMASDMKKPLGITVLRKRDIAEVIWPLPTVEMHGIGNKTGEKLATLHIHSIGDLAKASDFVLKAHLGIRGLQLKERANGIDTRHVDPDAAEENKSVGNSVTLPKDISNQSKLLEILESLSESVSTRLKKKGYVTKNISITIRYYNRKTISRGKKIINPIVESKDIYQAAKSLFLNNWKGDPVRLLGITGQDLINEDHAYEQLDLFSYEKAAQKEPLYKAIDKIKSKYGKSILQKGSDLQKK